MFYLKVPYREKELAKSLGAIWDKHLKQWVAYEDSDIGKIWRWLPKEPPSPRSPITPDEAWSALPLRTRDPKELMRLANIKSIPVKASGFCRACDSNVSNEWCFPDEHRPSLVYELHHLTQGRYNPLRPKKLPILIAALEEGRLTTGWRARLFGSK
jgi:Domain of unknown function (DUF5710)